MWQVIILPIPDGSLIVSDKPALCGCGRMHFIFVNMGGKTSCILRDCSLGIPKRDA
jgi:hypothetical protein